ncbi:unnamed protein product [Aphanomyces euteiches]
MLVIIVVVMSGCGKQAASSGPAASVQPNDPSETAVNSNAPKDPVMSQKELELSMLFRGLLQMDNKGELLITKDQAVSMQPIVSKSTEDGEITADNQKKLMALLTPEQKKFIDDLNARFKQFSGGNRNNPNAAGGGKRPALTDEQRAEFQKNQSNLTDEERKKLQETRGNRGRGQGAGTEGQGDQPQGEGQGGGQGNGGFGGGFGNFGDNVEQQLMDLLDTKINN